MDGVILKMLETIALFLTGVHFGVPLTYYYYAKARWLPRPWNIKIEENCKSKVTIILPTYNEEKIIRERLENIYNQTYPKELMEIIIVDSSNDKTPEIVEAWHKDNKGIKLTLIKEKARRGKAFALNEALRYANNDIVIIADADALWPENAVCETIKWFSDPSVGAVSCLKKPTDSGFLCTEGGYRDYYNILRLAESKAFSTPIFHGELAAFRRELLLGVGGFPTDIGADDSHTATKIASMGYRSITPEIWVTERVPKGGYALWKIRRAQHLIQHFMKAIKLKVRSKIFRKILLIEAYLHIINPWILLVAAVVFAVDILLLKSLTSLIILLIGLFLLLMREYRTWLIQQIYLMVAMIKNIKTKEIVWSKQEK
jgi:cellulose synthase/poly-beta-1,6-N-acetylglucosamine synthase-like glycosyltransferase